jgi:hypothetical protein
MSTWIIVSHRIVIHPRIPVPRLHPLARQWHNSVRLHEPPQRGVVPARPIVIQPKAGRLALPCVSEGRRQRVYPRRIALLAPRLVPLPAIQRPVMVRHYCRAAQVVAQQPLRVRRALRTIWLHKNPPISEE